VKKPLTTGGGPVDYQALGSKRNHKDDWVEAITPKGLAVLSNFTQTSLLSTPPQGGREIATLSTRFRSAPLIVGAVLIGTALAKLEKLYTNSMTEPTLIGSRAFQCFLIEVELAMAIGLAGNVWPRILRWAGLVLFGGFLSVALSRAVAGSSSCGCAGNLAVAPIVAVFSDLAMLALLWIWRPMPSAFASLRPLISLALVLLFLLPWPVVAALRSAAYPELSLAQVLDLGHIAPGQRCSFALMLRNPHDEPVEVASIHASCPCLKYHEDSWIISPGEEKSMNLAIDLGAEPEFVGTLLVEIDGRTPAGNTAFTGQVRAQVVRTPSNLQEGSLSHVENRFAFCMLRTAVCSGSVRLEPLR